MVGKGMCISAPSKKPVRISPQMEADNSQMLSKGVTLLINACDDVYLDVVLYRVLRIKQFQLGWQLNLPFPSSCLVQLQELSAAARVCTN